MKQNEKIFSHDDDDDVCSVHHARRLDYFLFTCSFCYRNEALN